MILNTQKLEKKFLILRPLVAGGNGGWGKLINLSNLRKGILFVCNAIKLEKALAVS